MGMQVYPKYISSQAIHTSHYAASAQLGPTSLWLCLGDWRLRFRIFQGARTTRTTAMRFIFYPYARTAPENQS